jgi:hypothetical protein
MANRPTATDADPTDEDDGFPEAEPLFEGVAPDWEPGARLNAAGWIEIAQPNGNKTRVHVSAVTHYEASSTNPGRGSIGLISGVAVPVTLTGGILELDELIQGPEVDPLGTNDDDGGLSVARSARPGAPKLAGDDER